MQILKTIILTLVLFTLVNVQAQTTANYIGTDTNWFNPNNWNTGVVPDATTDIIIHNTQVSIDPSLSPTGAVVVHDISMQGGTLTLLDNSVFEYNQLIMDDDSMFDAHSSQVSGDELQIIEAPAKPFGGMRLNPTTNDTRSIKIIAKTPKISMFIGGTIAASPGNTGMGHYATLLADDVELDGQLNVESIYGFNPTVGDTFQIVTARNSLIGTFDNAREGDVVARLNGLSMVISYAGGDGNDVVLTAVEDTSIPIDDIRTRAENQASLDIAFMQSFNPTTNKQGATFASVGGVGCEFANIQTAVDAGRDEVRIVTDTTFNENIFLTDISIKLLGGYSTCANANSGTQSSGKSQIIGVPNASEPVIAITGNAQRNTITLENLDLTGGSGSNFLTGGGISTLSSDAAVMVNNVDIHDNNSKSGGGIAIQGTANTDTDFILNDTMIYNNSALSGGGLFCSGISSSVLVVGNSGISFNTAIADDNTEGTGVAGGAYIDDACTLHMYSGTKNSSMSDKRGIAFNTAEHAIGGIAVFAESQVVLNGHQMCSSVQGEVVCIGDNDNPININDNSSALATGGISVSGNSTKLSFFAGLIENNTAGTLSGASGVEVVVGAEFETGRLYSNCWHNEKCNLFKNNSGGVVIDAITNTTINVFSSYFEGNQSMGVTAIKIDNSSLKLEGSIFTNNNNGTNVIQSSGMGTVITNSTFVDNNVSESLFSLFSDFTIRSSIITESNQTPLVQAAIVNYDKVGIFDCLISSELSSLSLSANISVNNAQIADPKFVDQAGGDYHLADNSPAIDLCLKSFIDEKDIDFQTRGYDDQNVDNQNDSPAFTTDAGADETYGSDIIFKNGFELN